MKRLTYFAFAAVMAFGFTACGEDTPDVPMNDSIPADVVDTDVAMPDIAIPELPADYASSDLTESGFAGSIQAPAGTEVYTSLLINNDGEQQQIVVQTNMDAPRIHMYKSDKDLIGAKDDVQRNQINLFENFLLEDDNSAFYHAKKQDGSDQYNFIMVINKEGQNWHVTGNSTTFDPISKEQAMNLYAMAKSIQ